RRPRPRPRRSPRRAPRTARPAPPPAAAAPCRAWAPPRSRAVSLRARGSRPGPTKLVGGATGVLELVPHHLVVHGPRPRAGEEEPLDRQHGRVHAESQPHLWLAVAPPHAHVGAARLVGLGGVVPHAPVMPGVPAWHAPEGPSGGPEAEGQPRVLAAVASPVRVVTAPLPVRLRGNARVGAGHVEPPGPSPHGGRPLERRGARASTQLFGQP